MTGYAATQQAMLLLGYTTPEGETDPQQHAEQWRMALPALQTVLADIRHLTRSASPLPENLAEELAVTEEVAHRVVVPGLAMHLARITGDGNGYNHFAREYTARRSGVARESRRVTDVIPVPSA